MRLARYQWTSNGKPAASPQWWLRFCEDQRQKQGSVSLSVMQSALEEYEAELDVHSIVFHNRAKMILFLLRYS